MLLEKLISRYIDKIREKLRQDGGEDGGNGKKKGESKVGSSPFHSLLSFPVPEHLSALLTAKYNEDSNI